VVNRKPIVLAVLAVLGWGLFLLKSTKPPVTVEKVVVQEVVKYKDRVVTKDVVRTETRPDGTKIVTETKSQSKSTESETSKTKVLETSKPVLSKYSLGVSLHPKTLFPFEPVYGLEVGMRLWQSPLWGTVSYNTDREWSIGLRMEF